MSKRSLFWSTASGKLGDIVLRSVRGETIASKYQPQVANPRTIAQMSNRILFADAVKFYRHANDNLFKFAYEDKKRNESDYNAFMRYNYKNGCYIDKDRMDLYTYPAFGLNWVLSNGSLVSPNIRVLSKSSDYPLELKCQSVQEQAGDSIARISTILTNDYGLQNGDYVTIIMISTYYNSYEIVEDAKQPIWYIRQFKIDLNNNDSITNYEIEVGFDSTNNALLFKLMGADKKGASCYAMIFSRPLKDKTLVSRSMTYGDETYNMICDNWLSQGAVEESLKTWGATPDAILRGTIVKNYE